MLVLDGFSHQHLQPSGEVFLQKPFSSAGDAATDFIKSRVDLPVKNLPFRLMLKFQFAVYYLVESTDGELLLIIRGKDCADRMHPQTTGFSVLRVDLVEGEFKGVDGLGRDAIFVGNNVGVSVAAADFPGLLEPNCIYFADDSPGRYVFCPHCWDSGFEDKIRCVHHENRGYDTGVYNVQGGIIVRFDVDDSTSRLGSPQWLFPSFCT